MPEIIIDDGDGKILGTQVRIGRFSLIERNDHLELWVNGGVDIECDGDEKIIIRSKSGWEKHKEN